MSEVLTSMRAVVREALAEDPAIDVDRSLLVCLRLQEMFGGSQVYLPRASCATREDIMRAFDGANHTAVIRGLRINHAALYRAIKERSGAG